MNDKDLHKLVASIRAIQPELPQHQLRLKAALMRRHAHQQDIRRQSLGAFIYTVIKGKTMKRLSITSPLVITLAIIGFGTASAAAAYWFKTSVSTSSHNNVVSIHAKDCPSIPASVAHAVETQVPARYSFDETYKIVDSSKVSAAHITAASMAMCEQRAIAAEINTAFPDMQEFSATRLAPNSKGLYFPIYLSGTISAVEGGTITVNNLSGNSAQASSATLQLAPDALLVKNGNTISSLHVGDVIYFAYQNRAVSGQTPDQSDLSSLKKTTDPGELSVVRGVGVMTTDNAAIKRLQDALQSGAVIQMTSDPQKG